MLFYSREIGRDGEKDYLDTADFRDVFFEQDSFNCISDKDEKATITYSLYYQEEGNKIGLEGTLKINGETITRQYEIKEFHIVRAIQKLNCSTFNNINYYVVKAPDQNRSLL